VQACWADHCQQMLTLRSIFLYLDRTHAITTAGVRSLFEMGLQLFRTHLAAHPEVRTSALPC
jgi:cullin-4